LTPRHEEENAEVDSTNYKAKGQPTQRKKTRAPRHKGENAEPDSTDCEEEGQPTWTQHHAEENVEPGSADKPTTTNWDKYGSENTEDDSGQPPKK
jgi:hypothetical protein